MIFTLNVGNTHTTLMAWRKGHSPSRVRWLTHASCPSNVLKILRRNSGSYMIVSSVVPKRWSGMQKDWKKFALKILSFRKAVQWDLAIRPRPAARVGEDRLAAAFGAAFLARAKFQACVVVDCGTALTVNAVTFRKREPIRFEGGLIVPSAALSLRVLATGTAQLPDISLPSKFNPAIVIGRNTKEAMRQGVLLAQLAAAAQLAKYQMKSLGRACVVLTGGLADDPAFVRAFKRHFKRGEVRVVPNLVHEGLFSAFFAAQLGRGLLREKPQ